MDSIEENYNRVAEAMEECLDVERGANLSTPLSEYGARPLNVIQVLKDLGVNYIRCTSGQALGREVREDLHNLAKDYLLPDGREAKPAELSRYNHLTSLASAESAIKFAERLNGEDLYDFMVLEEGRS